MSSMPGSMHVTRRQGITHLIGQSHESSSRQILALHVLLQLGCINICTTPD